MFTKSLPLSLLGIVLAGFAPSLAHAACGDRPGTPDNVQAVALQGTLTPSIQFKWRNTAKERVWWDIEVTDQTGKVVLAQTGIGKGVEGYHLPGENTYLVKAGDTRCFRIRARTAAGTQGCVSQRWSAKVCATVASAAPAPSKTMSGRWGALAADGKGRWGFAVGQSSEGLARDAALKGCGTSACKIAVAGQARCIAYFESRAGGYWYGLSLAATRVRALSVARIGCAKGAPAGTCKLVKAQCAS